MKGEGILKAFENLYHTSPTISVRAPGRINLIGEHTDYNDGFVLPAAINKAIYFCVSERSDREVHLAAVDLHDDLIISLDLIEKSDKSWANFLIGVLKEILCSGAKLQTGFNLAFGGDLPSGAGMSSSAAIESGMGYALNELYELGFSPLQLALIAQQAEHNFAGVRCGIMDMYASLMGKENQVICVDCRNLTHTYLPFESEETKIVLFNTGVSHNLGQSEYNIRREECEAGLGILKKHYPEITSFRDVDLSALIKHQSDFPTKVYNRCYYVLSEEERMKKATIALQNSDFDSFGKLMFETHEGLKNLYEVSCEELDFLVDLASENLNFLGSRMMGGGFGGCTINLVKKDALEEITEQFAENYFKRFHKNLEFFEVRITDGCSVVMIQQKQTL